MRLNQALSILGFCSRREGDRWIQAGKVFVNQQLILELGYQVNLTDQIRVGNVTKQLKKVDDATLWLYYKPRGLITTHKDPQGRPTVFEALNETLPKRVISVGRLDFQSEGLLLITNSNAFAHQAEKNHWERHYLVRFFGLPPSSQIIDQLQKGVTIKGIRYAPMQIQINPGSGKNHWAKCILTEGKNREIRKIFAHYNLTVSRLIRTQYGKYHLGSLKPGEYVVSSI